MLVAEAVEAVLMLVLGVVGGVLRETVNFSSTASSMRTWRPADWKSPVKSVKRGSESAHEVTRQWVLFVTVCLLHFYLSILYTLHHWQKKKEGVDTRGKEGKTYRGEGWQGFHNSLAQASEGDWRKGVMMGTRAWYSSPRPSRNTAFRSASSPSSPASITSFHNSCKYEDCEKSKA